ncbi:peptidase M61 [Hydrogenophaga crassostreae]|uniref:Peptidase M61 n=1 Tax=Hydrogenophaga crassostreae TaxID=1763535 RepID=A0A167IKI0_9BURK|nr:peptidase M61 [Hydrogenophaga crassostreae]OAD43095.1 peptidase M61 [Hydrogenophaga crassostreae]
MKTKAKTKTPQPGVLFQVEVKSLESHLFAIKLTVKQPTRRQRVSLPVWIPGSYLVREFAQHLQHMQATQGGKPVPVRQIDKNTWQTETDPTKPLQLSYEVYAFDPSVRTAFLDRTRGFFNATSLCVRVVGQDEAPHAIDISANHLPADWQLATGLKPKKVDPAGFGRYTTENYDELADCPVEMGSFWSGEFVARGVPHRFIVGGAGAWFDSERLLADAQRICEAQIDFWHGPKGKAPFKNYLFMLHASGEGYGGLEHRNSTALICQRTDLPALPPTRSTSGRAGGETLASSEEKPAALKATDGYTTLLGLISHEYFHTWNVKRMRPAEFRRYDYDRENHTELLWFFEGFTSYYDDLFLRRTGLINDTTYLHLVTKTFNQVEQTPGQRVQSVAQASFDAWLKYYRIQENSPNATVSYYTKGALLAICLDLTLRAEGKGTLDDVMRALWTLGEGGPVREADVARVLKLVGKRPFTTELKDWVHGTTTLPVLNLLEQAGAQVQHDKAPLAQQLGLRVTETNGVILKNVLRGGAAEAAGMAAGDEWLAVEFEPSSRAQNAESWRITKLEEVNLLRGQRTTLTAIVARDKRLLRCTLHWPGTTQAIKLGVADASKLATWLN